MFKECLAESLGKWLFTSVCACFCNVHRHMLISHVINTLAFLQTMVDAWYWWCKYTSLEWSYISAEHGLQVSTISLLVLDWTLSSVTSIYPSCMLLKGVVRDDWRSGVMGLVCSNFVSLAFCLAQLTSHQHLVWNCQLSACCHRYCW